MMKLSIAPSTVRSQRRFADDAVKGVRASNLPQCVFGKWQKSTLTLLYKGFHSYRWEGCKRIQLIIQLT